MSQDKLTKLIDKLDKLSENRFLTPEERSDIGTMYNVLFEHSQKVHKHKVQMEYKTCIREFKEIIESVE